MRRVLAGALIGLFLAGFAGCKTEKTPGAGDDRLPRYERIAEVHNQRVARLSRLWARTVVSMTYLDADGDSHYEQGDGHLQRLDSDKLALSVGKLGETLFWFGADAERYWLFDLATTARTRAFVGRHDLLTLEKAERASLPIPPRQFVALAGLTPLPATSEGAVVSRGRDGAIAVQLRHGGLFWRYHVNPITLLPSAIELLDRDARPLIVSALDRYRSVQLTGVGVNLPRAPGRIVVAHLPTDTSITLTIDGDIIDGRRAGKPRPQAFDFEFLIEALDPDEVIDLDEPPPAVDAP